MTDGLPDKLLAEDIQRCLRTHGELPTRRICKLIRKGTTGEGYSWQAVTDAAKKMAVAGRLLVRRGKNRANVYDVARGDPDEAEVAEPMPRKAPSNTQAGPKAPKPARTRPPRLRVVPEPAQDFRAKCGKVECSRLVDAGQLWCDPCARLSRELLHIGG